MAGIPTGFKIANRAVSALQSLDSGLPGTGALLQWRTGFGLGESALLMN